MHIDINSRMYKWAPLWFLHQSLYDSIAYECELHISRQTCGWSKFVGHQHPDICFQSMCMFPPVIFPLFMAVLIVTRSLCEMTEQLKRGMQKIRNHCAVLSKKCVDTEQCWFLRDTLPICSHWVTSDHLGLNSHAADIVHSFTRMVFAGIIKWSRTYGNRYVADH